MCGWYQVRGLPLTHHRIFVYTHSFLDAADKQRIRDRLRAAPCNLTQPLHYKPEIYTYLGYEYDNAAAPKDSTPQWVTREML
jgi:hypothetical protein